MATAARALGMVVSTALAAEQQVEANTSSDSAVFESAAAEARASLALALAVKPGRRSTIEPLLHHDTVLVVVDSSVQ